MKYGIITILTPMHQNTDRPRSRVGGARQIFYRAKPTTQSKIVAFAGDALTASKTAAGLPGRIDMEYEKMQELIVKLVAKVMELEEDLRREHESALRWFKECDRLSGDQLEEESKEASTDEI
jgi:hypothetical protein